MQEHDLVSALKPGVGAAPINLPSMMRDIAMGLFDFIKDLSHKESDSASMQQELLDNVNKAGLGLQNFQLTYEKGLATISGTALTQKDLELARLLVGNHRGVDKVNDDGLKVAAYAPGHSVPEQPLVLAPQAAQAKAPSAAPAAATPALMVTVKKGDTLSDLAQQYLGSANRYRDIFEANRPMLKDPDQIFPGQVLRIPAELQAHAPQAH